MKWNLRLAAAAPRQSGRPARCRRLLCRPQPAGQRREDVGLVVSDGPAPASSSAELDVICAVLGCGVEELLLPEPGKSLYARTAPRNMAPAGRCPGGRRRLDHAQAPRRPVPAAALRWSRSQEPDPRPGPRSCTDCLAWGVMEQIRCRACRSFRDGNRDERECTGCGRALRVKNRYCRLCWSQAVRRPCLGRDPAPGVSGRPGRNAGVKTGHHQLFFDRMAPRTGAAPRRPRRAPSPAAAWAQPGLPSPHARLGRRPQTRPSLAAAVRVADRLAEDPAGGPGEIRRTVRRGLAIALDGHHEGQDVAWSRALPALQARHLCARHVAEVLTVKAGLLDDDRRPAFETPGWTTSSTAWPTGSAATPRRWLRTLKAAAPQPPPQEHRAVHSHLGKAAAARCWTGPAYLPTSARSPVKRHPGPRARPARITAP